MATNIPPVTPQVGPNTVVTTGGSAVVAIPANPNGGLIQNPENSGEDLIVNPVGTASITPGGSNFSVKPGEFWTVIPGQTTPTSVNAASNNHEFTAIYW